jgi:Icc-related predicted phosphoesterase
MSSFSEALPNKPEDSTNAVTSNSNEIGNEAIAIDNVFNKRTIRIACISDTHSLHGQLEMPSQIDVLIHAGDFSRMGRVEDIVSFNEWLGTLQAEIKHRVVVLGNHEGGVFRRVDPASMLTNATAVLQSAGVTLHDLGGLRVWGTRFSWPMRPDSPCKNPEYTAIPDETDIVIAHGPALGFVDGGSGCPELRDALMERVKPKLFVCGHIHNAYGSIVCEETGTRFVNAASQKYGGGVNAPIVVEIEIDDKTTTDKGDC